MSEKVIVKSDFVVVVKYEKGVTVVEPEGFPRYLEN